MSAENGGAGGAGVVNIEALLAPIAGENPAGESLRYDDVYKEIRAARESDDQLNQGAWKRERKLADWPRVVELASEALATRSKDLQLGAWLSEALVRLYGFEGLRDALKVMRGLQLNFWDNVFPEMDDGDLAVRVVPVTKGDGDVRYTFNDYEDSRKFHIPEDLDGLDSIELERINKTRLMAADEHKVNSEQWRAVRDTTPRTFYEATFSLLNDCWAEFQALDAATDSKFGNQAPGFPLLQGTLEELRKLVEPILIKKRELEPDAVPTQAEAQQEAPAPAEATQPGAMVVAQRAPQAPNASAAVSSREEAYRKLVEAAAYFRQAEPHSPVSYLVERAVRWGHMPLEEWLAEVVKSEDVLLGLRETLGLKSGANGEQAHEGEDDG
jgi:type VI secretion system protein ImpA